MSVDQLSDRRWLSLSVTGSDLCLTNRGWEWFVSDKSKTNRGWKWFVSDKSKIFPKLSSKSTLDCVFQSLTVDRVTEIRETTTSVTANKICARVVLNQSSQFLKASCKCLTKNRKDPTSPKYYVKYGLPPQTMCCNLVPWAFQVTSSNRYMKRQQWRRDCYGQQPIKSNTYHQLPPPLAGENVTPPKTVSGRILANSCISIL